MALDTSALTKLIVEEPESPALLDELRDRVLVASDLVRVELRRVVARTVPRQTAAADALIDRLALVRLDAALLDSAGRLAPATLRTRDAIHVQSALLFGDELDTMITYDLRQADAARHAGLRVRAPA
jgi:predicted nucleic acid-binding protein